MDVCSIVNAYPHLGYLALVLMILGVEAWLGKTLKVESGSIAELLLNLFLRGKL